MPYHQGSRPEDERSREAVAFMGILCLHQYDLVKESLLGDDGRLVGVLESIREPVNWQCDCSWHVCLGLRQSVQYEPPVHPLGAHLEAFG